MVDRTRYEQSVLNDFRCKCSEIVAVLTKEMATKGANLLNEQGFLLDSECEKVCHAATPSEAARHLVDYVKKKQLFDMTEAFLNILTVGDKQRALVNEIMPPYKGLSNVQNQKPVPASSGHQTAPPTASLEDGVRKNSNQNDDSNLEYDMSSSPHGCCIIINNVEFNWSFSLNSLSLERRDGSHADADNLEKTFNELGYWVRRIDNLTSWQMVDLLTKFSKVDHSKFDSFICCVMSHGDNGYVYGCDSRPVSIDELTGIFQADRCTSLAEKPKLFFIQACQGIKEDFGFKIRRFTAVDGGFVSRPAGDHQSEWSSIPVSSDFLIGFCTLSGYVSYRHEIHGAPYINELCDVLNKYRQRAHLVEMLTMVNDRVAQYEFRDPKLTKFTKQMPEPRNRLRRKVFFRALTSVPKRRPELEAIDLSYGEQQCFGERAFRMVFKCALFLLLFFAAVTACSIFFPDTRDWLINVLPWYRLQPPFGGLN